VVISGRDEPTVAGRELSIVLGDDHAANRAGVRALIEPQGFRVVAESSDCASALLATIAHRPDVCLIVTWLPGDPIEAVRLIRQAVPETKIVLLTALSHTDELFGALRAGADGYLLMATSPARLAAAIRAVANGEAAIPRVMTTQLIRAFRELGHGRRIAVGAEGEGVDLTSREVEVVDRLRKGERTIQIARALNISEVTVRRHVSAVLRKLDVPNRSAMLSLLQRTGESTLVR
jgi:DNA-binding NarL/FixJ family response regulator